MKMKRTPAENQLRVYLKWCTNVKQLTPSTMATKRSVLSRFIAQTNIEDILIKSLIDGLRKRHWDSSVRGVILQRYALMLLR